MFIYTKICSETEAQCTFDNLHSHAMLTRAVRAAALDDMSIIAISGKHPQARGAHSLQCDYKMPYGERHSIA